MTSGQRADLPASGSGWMLSAKALIVRLWVTTPVLFHFEGCSFSRSTCDGWRISTSRRLLMHRQPSSSASQRPAAMTMSPLPSWCARVPPPGTQWGLIVGHPRYWPRSTAPVTVLCPGLLRPFQHRFHHRGPSASHTAAFDPRSHRSDITEGPLSYFAVAERGPPLPFPRPGPQSRRGPARRQDEKGSPD